MPGTSFRPDVNGFAFATYWQFDETETAQIRTLLRESLSATNTLSMFLPASPLVLPWLGQVRKNLTGCIDQALIHPYGLCGGMAYAALDYYAHPDQHFPRGTDPNHQPLRDTPGGTALRDYLWRRLIDSLAANVSTFLLWMAFLNAMPNHPLVRGGPAWLAKQSAKQLQTLKQSIDSGRPWPLGLVGTTTDPTLNHQVVTYGYEEGSNGTSTLYLYDMNCPGGEHTIQIAFEGQGLKVTESCQDDRRAGHLPAHRAGADPCRRGRSG